MTKSSRAPYDGNAVVSFEAPKKNTARNWSGEKEQVARIVFAAVHTPEEQRKFSYGRRVSTPVDLRIWTGRSSSSNVFYASLWASPAPGFVAPGTRVTILEGCTAGHEGRSGIVADPDSIRPRSIKVCLTHDADGSPMPIQIVRVYRRDVALPDNYQAPYLSGSDKAGGYGYHKTSAAACGAIMAAGVKLEANFSGCGDRAIEHAVKAVAEFLGWRDGEVLSL